MELIAGLRIGDAPGWRPRLALADRLQLNSGSIRAGDAFIARDDWRLPRAAELAMLCVGADAAIESANLMVIGVPAHLRRKFWQLLERHDGPFDRAIDGFDAFARELAAYLDFKRWPLPPGCVLEAAAIQPGRASTLRGIDAREPRGLDSSAAVRLGGGAGTLRGWINLGDEPSSFVIANLTAPQMLAMIPATHAAPPGDTTGIGRRFLAAFPDYPLIRITVAPGEGLLLPDAPIICDASTLARSEISVTLMLTLPQPMAI